MKRGYMDWKKELLPQEQLKLRQQEFIGGFAKGNLDAVVVYADVATADELQYLTNLGPYWANTTAIFFKDGSNLVVTGLSARVSPWVSQITGIDPALIIAAGPKISAKVASILKEKVGDTGVIGLAGKYFPQEMAAAIRNAGFTALTYGETPDEQLAKRDGAYLATIKTGIGLMTSAINKALQNQEIKSMNRKRVAAEVEYACRTAGAMDFITLNGDENLIFDQPQDVLDNEKSWTLYVQIQYLGEWLVLAVNMKEGYGKDALAARDQAARLLKPGQREMSWQEGGYTYTICTQIRSDHLASQVQPNSVLYENQVVSLAVADKEKGVYLENMYLVTAGGGELLFSIKD